MQRDGRAEQGDGGTFCGGRTPRLGLDGDAGNRPGTAGQGGRRLSRHSFSLSGGRATLEGCKRYAKAGRREEPGAEGGEVCEDGEGEKRAPEVDGRVVLGNRRWLMTSGKALGAVAGASRCLSLGGEKTRDVQDRPNLPLALLPFQHHRTLHSPKHVPHQL